MLIAKINAYGLLSYIPDRGVCLQDLRSDYDIGLALHFDSAQVHDGALVCKVYLGQERFQTLPVPDFIKESYVDFCHGNRPRDFASNSVYFLRVDWGRSHNPNSLYNFLEFFGPGSYLSFRGEYGVELVCFIPFARFLYQNGHLRERHLITYSTMQPYYADILNVSKFRADHVRRDNYQEYFRFPSYNICEYKARRSRFEYHDYYVGNQSFFSSLKSRSLFVSKRKKIFISNKFCVEWALGPINYIPLIIIQRIFELCSTDFEIVYSRPGIAGYDVSRDNDRDCQYPDGDLVNLFDITCLEFRTSLPEYNETKVSTASMADFFITVQGGGSLLLPIFGKPIVLYHLRGPERELGQYDIDAYYDYSSPSGLSLTVCHSVEDFYHKIFSTIQFLRQLP
jgi:hypothetical protein